MSYRPDARLFEAEQTRTKELAEALEQQTATSEVLGVISSSPGELEPVFQAMLANATRICEAKFGAIYLFEGDAFRAVALRGGPPSFVEARRRNPVLRPIPGTGLGRVAATKQTVQIADVQVEPAYRSTPEWTIGLELGGIRSVLCVPMLKEDELIGAFNLFRHEVRPFTDEQIALVTNFAAQAVIAVENTRLFEAEQTRTRELQESLKYQSATSEVLSVIARAPSDLQQVLDAVAETAARACMATEVRVFRLEGDKLRRAARVGRLSLPDGVELSPDLPMGRGSVTGRAVAERRTIHVEDLAKEIEFEFPDAAAIQKVLGHRTTLATPLLRDGDLGAILVLRTEVAPFSDKQIRLLETFADQAVIAIENARLFEEVQARTHELAQSLEYQTDTSDVLSVISRSPNDLQPVLDTIARSAAQLCKAQFCYVFRFDGQLIHFAAHHGLSPDGVEATRRHYPIAPGRASAAARSILSGTIEEIPDIDADAEYEHGPGAKSLGYRSMLAVPMLKEGLAIGAVVLARFQIGRFPERQIALLQTFADQAVIAVENTRLFEAEQASKRELQESLEYQTAISDVLAAISSSPNALQPVFDAIVRSASRLCGGEYAIVNRYDGKLMHLVAQYNPRPAGAEETTLFFPRQVRRETSVGARALLDGVVLNIPDVEADDFEKPEKPVCDFYRRIGIRALLVVPMLHKGHPIGAIQVSRALAGAFSPKQVELLKTFADQAVIAIENTRLFEEVQTRTEELTESLEYQTAISEVLAVISRSTSSLQPVFDTIAAASEQLCQADRAQIFIRRDDGFHLAAQSNTPERAVAHFIANPFVPSRRTATERALLEGRTIHVQDVTQDTD